MLKRRCNGLWCAIGLRAPSTRWGSQPWWCTVCPHPAPCAPMTRSPVSVQRSQLQGWGSMSSGAGSSITWSGLPASKELTALPQLGSSSTDQWSQLLEHMGGWEHWPHIQLKAWEQPVTKLLHKIHLFLVLSCH